MPEIPSFDSALLELLKLLGINSIVIILVTLVLVAASWYTGVTGIAKLALLSGRRARDAFNHMSATLPRMDRAGVAIATTVSLLTVLAQVGLVLVSYVVGNYLSFLFGQSPALDGVPRLRHDPVGAVLDGEIWPHLALDHVSSTYVVAVVVAILLSYFWDGSPVPLAFVVSLPGLVLVGIAGGAAVILGGIAFFTLLLAVFMALVGQGDPFGDLLRDGPLDLVIVLGVMAVMGYTYWLACRGALQCSGLTVNLWRASASRAKS